jgi:hypothetical protein
MAEKSEIDKAVEKVAEIAKETAPNATREDVGKLAEAVKEAITEIAKENQAK